MSDDLKTVKTALVNPRIPGRANAGPAGPCRHLLRRPVPSATLPLALPSCVERVHQHVAAGVEEGPGVGTHLVVDDAALASRADLEDQVEDQDGLARARRARDDGVLGLRVPDRVFGFFRFEPDGTGIRQPYFSCCPVSHRSDPPGQDWRDGRDCLPNGIVVEMRVFQCRSRIVVAEQPGDGGDRLATAQRH